MHSKNFFKQTGEIIDQIDYFNTAATLADTITFIRREKTVNISSYSCSRLLISASSSLFC